MPRTSKKKPEYQTNGISALIKELWQAAVNLRGSVEPADYKRYVLPIIFLRFVSLQLEAHRAVAIFPIVQYSAITDLRISINVAIASIQQMPIGVSLS
jgi:hypothetical protein